MAFCLARPCPDVHVDLRNSKFLTIDKEIGAGAFGVVYTGMYLHSPVAIKRIKEVKGKEQVALDNFMRDVTALTQLRHPNIVSIVAHSSEFIVMPLASMSLMAYMKKLSARASNLTYGAFSRILTDCNRALLYMHFHFEQCIVHSDIKPDNILLEVAASGEITKALLGDVGIARSCASAQRGGWAGTPGYMPVTGAPANAGHDVHALAVSMMQVWAYPMPVQTPFSYSDTLILGSTLEAGHAALPTELKDIFMGMILIAKEYDAKKEYSLLLSCNELLSSSTRNPDAGRTEPEQAAFLSSWMSALKTLHETSTAALKSPSIQVQSKFAGLLSWQLQLVIQQWSVLETLQKPADSLQQFMAMSL